MKGKKGAELTIGTLVIIVLAVIVLVVLVLGFTTGWKDLWSRITSFFGGSNVDTVVQACTFACETQGKYDFCERTRTVKAETDSDRFWVDKDRNAINPLGEEVKDEASRSVNSAKLTCKQLAEWYQDLNFQECPGLCD